MSHLKLFALLLVLSLLLAILLNALVSEGMLVSSGSGGVMLGVILFCIGIGFLRPTRDHRHTYLDHSFFSAFAYPHRLTPRWHFSISCFQLRLVFWRSEIQFRFWERQCEMLYNKSLKYVPGLSAVHRTPLSWRRLAQR